MAELEELYQEKKKKLLKDHFKHDMMIHYLDKYLKAIEESLNEKNLWSTLKPLKTDVILV